MKPLRYLALALVSAGLASCTGLAGQPEPLTQAQAIAVAQKAVRQREDWPACEEAGHPNLIRTICFSPSSNPDGSWSVTVHQATSEMDSGNTGFIPGTKRILTISKTGKLKRYLIPKTRPGFTSDL